MSKYYTDPDEFQSEEDLDKEMDQASQELRDEFYQQKPVTGLLLEPGKPPQITECFDNDECWSSLIGPDWVMHDMYDGLAVIMHNEEGDNLLQPNFKLYLPHENKEIIVYGALIAMGRCYSDLNSTIPYEGPWICSISNYNIYKLGTYIRALDEKQEWGWL